MTGKTKCEDLFNTDQSKPQPYFSTQVKMGFHIQTRMIVCPGNMKKKFMGRMECEVWREEGEVSVVASQAHLVELLAYSRLRVGRDLDSNFTDVINYFSDIMRVGT